ncbi:MAG: subtype I-E CRISPR-associated endonuclease Cas1, partial [Microvirgula sp.]
AGYAPAIGFIHSGKPLSFVYDIADLYKFETVVPAAFAVAAKSTGGNDERTVRQSCRDMFRRTRLLERIIPDIEDLLAAGGLSVPVVDGVVEVAIPEEKGLGDAGHRT